MSQEMRCGDPAALAGYLYDEIDSADRAAVERHLAICEICASEVEGLRATRAQIAEWTPPEAHLGFRIVSESGVPDTAVARVPSNVVPMRRWWQWSGVPVWAHAAAAVMLFALGAVVAAIMNMEVRYDAAGLTVRTGWQSASAPSGAAADKQVATETVSAKDLSALESRMRAEFMRARAADGDSRGVSGGAQPGPVLASNGEMIRQMRQLVADSEARQQRELAFRVAQVVRDLDSTHRADLARIERTVSPMEGVTSEELQQQRQMLNYLLRVSQQK